MWGCCGVFGCICSICSARSLMRPLISAVRLCFSLPSFSVS